MTSAHSPSPRYWEIDLFRGIAVLMMIVFHTVFDFSYFSIFPITVSSGFWRYFAILTAFMFIFLVGVSLNISHYRAVRLDQERYTKYLKRGGKILGLGLMITLVTYLIIGEGFIIFGVLHCIGVSILIAPIFFDRPRTSLLGAIIVLALGFLVAGISGPVWFAWIGIHPAFFYTLDYFPIFPWFGVILLGLIVGMQLYPHGNQLIFLSIHPPKYASLVCWMGRHSLVLYLVHQPVILIILALLFPGSIWFFP